MPLLAEGTRRFIKQLSQNGPAPTSGVSGYERNQRNVGRAGTGRHATCSGVGEEEDYVRISTVVDIQQGTLRAALYDEIAALTRTVERVETSTTIEVRMSATAIVSSELSR